MRGASESPRPRGHPGRGVGAPGRGVQRAVRTEPTARAPRACAPRCGCGTRRPWARLRSTRAPCGADRTPPPAFHVPERPGAGAGAGAVRRRCAAIRAGPAGGSGPRAHHVQRRLPHAWGAVSLLGVRRDVGTGAGPDVPRTAAAAAPGCAHCAATAPSPSSGGHRQRPSFPWTPVRAPRWAQAGRRRARHAPRAAAAPGPGACRQRRGEGGAVLGRCALAPARVSASRRAGGGSTRR